MSGRVGSGRREQKFVVPVDRREALVRFLEPHMMSDTHAVPLGGGACGYWVHTLYFDTADLSDYFDRLQERRVRNRLRIRTYGNPGDGAPVFLENKRKSGKWVVKHRVRVDDGDTWCARRDPRPWTTLSKGVENTGRYAARCFCSLVDGGRRVPVTVVHYLREVFVPRTPYGCSTRLTLDRHVRATVDPSVRDLFASPEVDLIPPEWMILEVKFDRYAPPWMQELARIFRTPLVPVSKFGLSVAKGLRGEHPSELRYLTPHPIRRHS